MMNGTGGVATFSDAAWEIGLALAKGFAGLLVAWVPLAILCALLVWGLGGSVAERGARISQALAAAQSVLVAFFRGLARLLPTLLPVDQSEGRRIILAEAFAAVSAQTRRARSEIQKAMQVSRSGGADIGKTLGDLDAKILKLQLDEFRIAQGDGGRRAGALWIAIALTFFGVCLICVNTAMLHTMFRDLVPKFVIPIVNLEVSWVLGAIYTIIELGVGVVLKGINRNPPSMGRTVSQIAAVVAILALVGVETFLYGLVSMQSAALPPDIAAQFPLAQWWLALMGLALALGLVLIGYWAGSAWIEVDQHSGAQNLHRAVGRLNTRLRSAQTLVEQLSGRIREISATIPQPTPSGSAAPASVAPLRESVAALDAAFARIQTSEVDLHVADDGRAGIQRVTVAIALGVAALALLTIWVIGASPLLLRFDLLRGSAPIGPPLASIVVGLTAFVAGYLAVPTLALGRIGTPDTATTTFRPTGWRGSLVPVLAAGAIGLTLIILIVILATKGARMDWRTFAFLSVLVTCSFALGIWLDRVAFGVYATLRVVALGLARAIMFVAFCVSVGAMFLLRGASWLLETILHLLAKPALWAWSALRSRNAPPPSRGAAHASV